MLAQLDFLFRKTRDANSYIAKHRHRCYEIVYYVSGTGQTRLGDIPYAYKDHMYAVIPPGLLHDEHRTEETDVICIGFSLMNRELPPLEPGLYLDATQAILGTLLTISRELQEKQSYYIQKLALQTSEMVIEHLRTVTPAETNVTGDHLMFARTYIEENFTQKISVKDLANMSGYSYHHFRHLFKVNFGISPIQYLTNKRLERARSLLRYTSLPITAITNECGFANDAQFCTIFKREVGETPRTYRQNNRYTNTLYKGK